MSDEQSRVIRRIYAGALQHDPEERDEYLSRACSGDPELRDRVAALLDAHAVDFGETGAGLRPRAEPSARASADSGLAGRHIGTYLIRHELGRGGMGVVYLAHDTRLSRTVAIKALSPALSRSPEVRQRLLNEAQVAGGLSHPGIATVYALEEIDGELYLACEYVPGAPLRALLKSGPVPIVDVVDIGVQLARALAEAHTKGIVHRDIKPENVIKTPSGVVKMLDFGLARADYGMRPGVTQTGMVVGTPGYLAPEQALGQQIDFRADIFALGLLLYELASGTNPFIANSIPATIARIVDEDPPLLSDVQPHSVPDLDRIIQRCLRKNPLARYGATHEIVVDLERLHAELTRHPNAASPRAAAANRRGRHRTNPQRWLANHQVVMSVVYLALLYPAWYARGWLTPPWNTWFLLSVLAAAAGAMSLRLHLLFIALTFPHQLPQQQAATGRWTRLCDVMFAVTQVAAALVVGADHPEFAMLFIGVSVAVLVTSFVIEPATVRTALGERAPGR